MTLFFFNDTATTEIYTLSLHDALPILYRIARAVCPSPAHQANAAENEKAQQCEWQTFLSVLLVLLMSFQFEITRLPDLQLPVYFPQNNVYASDCRYHIGDQPPRAHRI